MPGGFLHKPLWTPYGLYGTIDHVYGFKAYNAHSGWTAAQGSLNVLETVAYAVYLYLVYTHGEVEEGVQGRGAPDKEDMGLLGRLSESRTVYGRMAGWVTVIAYTTAQITFWKTVLYWLLEAYSGECLPDSPTTNFVANDVQASTTLGTMTGRRSSSCGSFRTAPGLCCRHI